MSSTRSQVKILTNDVAYVLDRYVALPQPQKILTKGDNNPVDDIDLYNGIDWLERRHIIGKVKG